MQSVQFEAGEGRSRITLQATRLGGDLVVYIFNENAHLGAVAIAEWDSAHRRVSVSVHTRLGHKDDAVAQRAAHAISKSIEGPVCVIAGIHLDAISQAEIEEILSSTDLAVEKFTESLDGTQS